MYFALLASRLLFLMIFRCESGCLEMENQAFGKRGIAKINFRRSWISHDDMVHFFMLLGGLTTNFMIFLFLEIGSTILTFRGYLGATSNPEYPLGGW